jgi:ABC-type transport system involved in cytochrome c biogenesis permease subunit
VAADKVLYLAASFALFALVLLEWIALCRPLWVTKRLLRGVGLLFVGLQGTALICSALKWGPLGMAHPWPSTMLVVEGALVVLLLTDKSTKPTGVGASVATLAFIVHSWTFLLGTSPAETLEISPFARSVWYALYVAGALAAYSAYLNAGGGAIAYALSSISRAAGFGPQKLSTPDGLAFSRAALVLAFPFLSASMVARTLWTYLGWGSYWTWDLAGIWPLVLWLILGLTLHIRISRRRLRWTTAFLAILGLTLALAGLPLLSSGLAAAW